MNKKFGYIRVSSKENNIDWQLTTRQEYGIPNRETYIDKLSGKDFECPQYLRMIKEQTGRYPRNRIIDRLGRNHDKSLEQWRHITKEIRADSVVHDMPLHNTRQGKDLTGTLVAQLLSYAAQTEREFIRRRQAEGIVAAKAKGMRM